MSKYWNFRQILDIDPQTDTCVGIAKSYKTKPQCNNKPSSSSRRKADQILNQMDRQKTISTAALRELAKTMLCKGEHNSPLKPLNNQVTEVYNLWETQIRDYMKREVEKAETQILKWEASQIRPMAKDLKSSKDPANKVQTHSSSQMATRAGDRLDQLGPRIVPLASQGSSTNPFANYNRNKSTSSSVPLFFNAETPFRTFREASMDAKPACQEETKILSDIPYLPSPPETPLKFNIQRNPRDHPASSIADTIPELPAGKAQGAVAIPEASNKTSNTTIRETIVSSKFDVNEQVSLLDAFNSTFETAKTLKPGVAEGSSDTGIKTKPTTDANFAAEFESKKSFPKLFIFGQSPGKNHSPIAFNPLSIAIEAKEVPVFRNEHKAADEVPTLDAPTTSESPNLLTLGESSSSVPPTTIDPCSAPQSPCPPSSSAISDELPALVSSTSRSLESPKSLHGPMQPPTVSNNPSVSEVPKDPDTPHQEKILAAGSPTISEPPKPLPSLDTLNQEPLPACDFKIISKLPNLKARTKAPSSKQPRNHKANVDHPSQFQFGSHYIVPPKTFDFDTWSKVSLAARLPKDFSTIWGSVDSAAKDGSGTKISDREVIEKKVKHLRNEEVAEKPMEGTSTNEALVSLSEEPLTKDNEHESFWEQSATPLKLPICQNDVPITPEATTEPSQKHGKVESILAEDTTIVIAQSTPPNSDGEEAVTIIEEDATTPEATPEATPEKTQSDEISSTIEDTSTIESTSEPAAKIVITRAQSFGYAAIGPQQHYKTRFSEKQRRNLPTPPESPEASNSFDNGDVFSEVNIEPLINPLPLTPSPRVRRKPVPSSQQPESSGNVEDTVVESVEIEEEADAGERAQIEWENSPRVFKSRRSLGRKFTKQVLRLQSGWDKVSEAVHRKSGHGLDD